MVRRVTTRVSRRFRMPSVTGALLEFLEAFDVSPE